MSYTPTTWNTGDTITASAMNKIEQGIANAGGGVDCVLYTDSNGNTAAYGDFASALAKVSSGVPICVFGYEGTHSSGYFGSNAYPLICGWAYEDTYPNQIKLYTSSSTGYIWDANGLTWWD